MQGLKWGMAALLAAGFAVPALAETTVLTNLTLIDGVSAAAQPNSAIMMTNGKITYVGPAAGLTAPKDAAVQDLAGKVVMPGIIDSHVHIGLMHDVTQDEK